VRGRIDGATHPNRMPQFQRTEESSLAVQQPTLELQSDLKPNIFSKESSTIYSINRPPRAVYGG
jgi:hypothetical protein